MARIVLFGASGHARVIADILRKANSHVVVGIIDPELEIGSVRSGVPVLGSDDDLQDVVERWSVEGGIVAIGDNGIRRRIQERVHHLLPDFRFVTAIHPAAELGTGVVVGDGTVVMAGAVINAGSVIGTSCILNTGVSLDHDSVMEDYSSLAPRAVTGGHVTISTGAAVGIGAVIIHGAMIGEHAVVGAGSTVIRNIPPRVVAYGSPARVVRAREPGDRYL